MKVELVRGSHCVGESNLHLQFTPAYRQDIFCDEAVRILTRDYLIACARIHKFEILAMGFGDEHAHMFVSRWKNFSIPKLAQLLKGFSSRMMRKFHKELFEDKLYGKKFWSAGYFYRTVGVMNASTVKRYVEESQEYGFAESECSNQRKLIEFSSHQRSPLYWRVVYVVQYNERYSSLCSLSLNNLANIVNTWLQ